MKPYFLSVGFIASMFFMWMPVNSAEQFNNAKPSRTPSKTFVHERKTSLSNIGKLTNKWVAIISQIPKEEESKKIDLLRLLEWDAYYNPETRKDLPMYDQALSDLKQSKFDFGGAPQGEKAVPVLNPQFTTSSIENNELKNGISVILKNVHNATIGNFNYKINNYTQQIQEKLNELQKKPFLAPKIEPVINNFIARQLKQIQEKAHFTHDINELKNDLEKLSTYQNRIKDENLILFKQLEKKALAPDIELPITEPAPEEQPSSSISIEEPREPEKESELPIIPYEQFSLAKLFKITNPETQASASLPENPLSSSSSSSSTSPINVPIQSPSSTPPSLPRPRKEEITTDYPQEPAPENNQLPEAPSQATEDESSEESEPTITQKKSPDNTNPSVVDVVQQKKESFVQDIPEPKAKSPSTSDVNTAINTTPPPSNPPTQTQPTSFFWDSWIIQKITAFFDKFLWAIYGGYR